FVMHYHAERNHLGPGNDLIAPAHGAAGRAGIRCRAAWAAWCTTTIRLREHGTSFGHYAFTRWPRAAGATAEKRYRWNQLGKARIHSRRPSRTRPAAIAWRKARSPRHQPISVRRSVRTRSSSGNPGLKSHSDTSARLSKR